MLFFFLQSFGQYKINSYEYWFDNNYAGKTSVPITPVSKLNLSADIPTTSLNPGLHIFNIRFNQNDSIYSTYSTTLSRFFQKLPSSSALTNEIIAYEYWFDNDYAGKIYQYIIPQSNYQLLGNINAQALTKGLHIFHIRFRDNGNTWSSALSNFFYKTGEGVSIPNFITAYRYWFDAADSAITNVQLPTPVSPYLLNNPLDLSNLLKGNHTIHFQFEDTLQNWSSVTTDAFYKSKVVADFLPDKWTLCDSGQITFTNLSKDADSYHWIFDDSTTNNISAPVHFFNSYGIHPVTLIAIDNTTGFSDTITLNITVKQGVVVNLGNDTSVCSGSSVLLTASDGNTYLWNTGDTTQSISADTTGSYFVQVTNSNNCSATDTVTVSINPLPTADAGNNQTVCTGISVILIATGGVNYQWTNGVTQGVPFSPTATNTYNVTVTDSNGCSATNNVIVTINPFPSAANTISGSVIVCPGQDSINYIVPVISDASSYVWTLPAGTTGTSSTNSIFVNYGYTAVSGNITVEGQNSCGYGIVSTLPVTVYQIPPTPVITNNGSTLTSNASNGNQWYKNNTLLPGATNQVYVISADGNYYDIVTLNGCSSDTSNIISYNVGIEEFITSDEITVFPNPANDKIIIEYSIITKNQTISVYSILGQLLIQQPMLQTKINIDVSSFPSGIYAVEMKTEKGIALKKFVKD